MIVDIIECECEVRSELRDMVLTTDPFNYYEITIFIFVLTCI
jgi:hypothetical protein